MSYITEQNQPPGWYPESVGEGGDLPTVISKIDGGSFTVENDTSGDNYPIAHNLGVAPKGFAIWTEDKISGTSGIRYLGECSLVAMNIKSKSAVIYVAGGGAGILQNGDTSNVGAAHSSAGPYMNAERIRWNNSQIFYKAGLTYKWVAWA